MFSDCFLILCGSLELSLVNTCSKNKFSADLYFFLGVVAENLPTCFLPFSTINFSFMKCLTQKKTFFLN